MEVKNAETFIETGTIRKYRGINEQPCVITRTTDIDHTDVIPDIYVLSLFQ